MAAVDASLSLGRWAAPQMPLGITHPVFGYAGFVAVKFAGYALAAHYIAKSYRRADRNRYVVGGVRTLIGMGTGAAYAGIWSILPAVRTVGGLLYFVGLAPVRVAEWWLLLWLFFDCRLENRPKGWGIVRVSTVWSYVLDLPAAIGFFVTGGLWIC
jgi:hypothetical protein